MVWVVDSEAKKGGGKDAESVKEMVCQRDVELVAPRDGAKVPH